MPQPPLPALPYPGSVPASASRASEIDLEAARRRIEGRVRRTPLAHSRLLDARAGARVWLKAENLQRAGSFKARGAFNAALVGLEQGDRRGLLALSSGNHGQALALAAAELGLAATVVMPASASPVKVAAVRGYGAEAITEGVTQENREQVTARLAEERGLRFIHPHDDPHVISGQATVGFELAEQLESRGVAEPLVLVPVGGGGLISGVLLALLRALPRARVLGVEPEAGNDGQLSLQQGRRVSLPAPPQTVADGAATMRLGELCWELIREHLERIVTVSDPEVAEACWWLWSRCKLVVEPTGAMTVAALLAEPGGGRLGGLERGGAEVVCVLSGGNCLPQQLASLIGPRA